MKGIVFSVSGRESDRFFNHRFPDFENFSLKRFLSLYGLQLFFICSFVFGVVWGICSYSKASKEFLSHLDFLFVTNLESRLNLTAFECFCSSFSSAFIFIFATFLLAFTLWGVSVLPLLCALKGYGVGVCASYMISAHSITGVGFYILVVLPGTILFLLAFVLALKESFSHSLLMFKSYAFSAKTLSNINLKSFLFRYLVVLIIVSFSSVIDMILWILFANMFNF